MRALISDIHSNLEALEAVLRHISLQGVDEIWCLGDIVGYGPNPKECIDLVERNCSLVLMGNHDWAVINSPVGFNSVATRMVYRTKEWLRVTEESTEKERARWAFLEELDLRAVRGDFLLVHASPRAELTEYLLPTDARYEPEKFEEVFQLTDTYLVGGHTHVPCCVTEDLRIAIPGETGSPYELDDRKSYVNIGSVGQPRDGDPRASYVILDDGHVTWHRVPYPHEKTAKKISTLGEEYEVLGYRLSIGR